MNLDQSVAVVTGGASGIGLASALAFAERGADVVVADVQDTSEAVAQIEQLGRRALGVRSDLSKRDATEGLVDEAIDWQGHVDVFMCNAGVGLHGPPHKIPIEDWEWALDVNVRSHVWAVHRVLPHMLERERGHLVHTASAAGLMGSAYFAPYCMTKFAVVGLAESLAVYCAGRGVGVSVVCPMYVDTNLGRTTRMSWEEPIDAEHEARLRVEYKEYLTQVGISPADAAKTIANAVLNDEFWVFTHPDLWTYIEDKWKDGEAWIRASKDAWVAQGKETKP